MLVAMAGLLVRVSLAQPWPRREGCCVPQAPAAGLGQWLPEPTAPRRQVSMREEGGSQV